MKIKTTNKEVENRYYNIISVGYCELQSLLSYKNPVAYSAGTYGWNYDVYDIDGVAIVTGYRPISAKNGNASYELANEYEIKSKGKTAKEKDILLKEFIKKATKQKAKK